MGQTDFARDNFSFSREFCGVNFGDRRLNQRFIKVVDQMLHTPSAVIHRSQSSWAEMMGAYRLFQNDKVTEGEILRAHGEQTIARMSEYKRVIVIQDTSVLSFSNRLATEGLGSIAMGAFGKSGKGILLHTTMAVTTDGTPLGILDQMMWSRGILKKSDPLFESERTRWTEGISSSAGGNGATQVICVADREADGADFYAQARRKDVSFVVRAKGKARMSAKHPGQSVREVLAAKPAEGRIKFKFKPQKKHQIRVPREVTLEVRFGEVQLRPQSEVVFFKPRATDDERTLNAVLVEEVHPPEGEEAISWLLFTDLSVTTLEDAKAVLEIYRTRWEIETFHKLLKSACDVEMAQLEDASRLKKLITTMSVVAWRLHVLVKLQREMPEAPCTELLTKDEWQTLYIMANKTQKLPKKPPTLREATLWIAKLGHFIGRKGDGEPGPLVLARGWQKFRHFMEASEILKDVYKR